MSPLADYKVTCDESNNPPESIAQGRLNVTVDLTGPLADQFREGLKCILAREAGATYDAATRTFIISDRVVDHEAILEDLVQKARSIDRARIFPLKD